MFTRVILKLTSGRFVILTHSGDKPHVYMIHSNVTIVATVNTWIKYIKREREREKERERERDKEREREREREREKERERE